MFHKIVYGLLLVLIFGTSLSFSQNNNSLKKEAEKLFENKQFNDAKTKYRQLLNLDQKNIDFNFKYAVCIYETENKLNAKRYIDFILKQNGEIPLSAHYYRGKIFQYEYDFDNAIAEFEKCKNDKLLQKESSIELNYCVLAKNQIKLKSNLVVLSKFITQNGNHEKYYQFSKPYSFYSPEKNEIFVKSNSSNGYKPRYIYLSRSKYRIFPSYSENKENGLDIFIQTKNNDSEWSEIKKIPTINTIFDENYPFYDDSLEILYFASKGHNSIGGYDIFKVDYDWKTNTVGEVENIGFPYNTPSDDYLFVPDNSLNCTFFTSNRSGDPLNSEVFKVSITKQANRLIASQTHFLNEIDEKTFPVEITIRNINSNESFGPFKSDKNGNIAVYYPVAGNYEILAEFSIYGESKNFISKPFEIQEITIGQRIDQIIRYYNENSIEKIDVSTRIKYLDELVEIDPLELQEISRLTINEKSISQRSTSNEIGSSNIFLKLNIQENDEKIALDTLIDRLLEKEIDMENNERFRLQANEKLNKNRDLIASLNTEIQKMEESSAQVEFLKNQIRDLLEENLVLYSYIEKLNELNSIRPNLDDVTLLNEELNEYIKTKTITETKEFIESKLKLIQNSLNIVVVSLNDISKNLVSKRNDEIQKNNIELKNYDKQIDSLTKVSTEIKSEMSTLSKKKQEQKQVELAKVLKQITIVNDLKSEAEYKKNVLNAETKAFQNNIDLITYVKDESLQIKTIGLLSELADFDSDKEEIIVKLLESKNIEQLIPKNNSIDEIKMSYERSKIQAELIKDNKERAVQLLKIDEEFLKDLEKLSIEKEDEVVELIQLTKNRIQEDKEIIEEIQKNTLTQNNTHQNKENVDAKKENTSNNESLTQNNTNQNKENVDATKGNINNQDNTEKNESLTQNNTNQNKENVDATKGNINNQENTSNNESLTQNNTNQNKENVDATKGNINNQDNTDKNESLTQNNTNQNKENVDATKGNINNQDNTDKNVSLTQNNTNKQTENVEATKGNINDQDNTNKNETLTQNNTNKQTENVEAAKGNINDQDNTNKNESLTQNNANKPTENIDATKENTNNQDNNINNESITQNNTKLQTENVDVNNQNKINPKVEESKDLNSENSTKKIVEELNSSSKEFNESQLKALDKLKLDVKNESKEIGMSENLTIEKIKQRTLAREEKSKERKELELLLGNYQTQSQLKESIAIKSALIADIENEIKQEKNEKILIILKNEKQFLEDELIEFQAKITQDLDQEKVEIKSVKVDEIEKKQLTNSKEYLDYAKDRIALARSESASLNIQEQLGKIEVLLISNNNLSDNQKKEMKDSIIWLQKQLIENNNNNQKLITKLLSYEDHQKFESMLDQKIRPIIQVQSHENPIQKNYRLVSTESISYEKPLPIGDTKLSGLLFRVQVGAFRKAVPPTLFREFTPVNGEVIANGLTCYMAGYFNNSQSAIKAREEIRSLGYSDAFIVAYCDGKRISYELGQTYERTKQCISLSDNELSIKLKDILQKEAQNERSDLTIENKRNASFDEFGVEVAGYTDHLYFSVQVGVFNKSLNPLRLNGINELIIHKADNGQLRYSSGKFENLNEAKNRKTEVNNRGIADAFVVAYYKGKRISFTEAQKIIERNPDIVKNNTSNENKNISELNEENAVNEVANIDFSVLESKKSTKKYYYEIDLKEEEIWDGWHQSLPCGYDASSEISYSPLFEKPFTSPEVLTFVDKFNLKEFKEKTVGKISFNLSEDNSGEIVNHILRSTYTFEFNGDKLVLFPKNQTEMELIKSIKEQIEQ